VALWLFGGDLQHGFDLAGFVFLLQEKRLFLELFWRLGAVRSMNPPQCAAALANAR
jgi:hypothetical protein